MSVVWILGLFGFVGGEARSSSEILSTSKGKRIFEGQGDEGSRWVRRLCGESEMPWEIDMSTATGGEGGVVW